jgi:CRP/FNR family transcriptional regulator
MNYKNHNMVIHPELIANTVNNIFYCCPTVIKNEVLNHMQVMEVAENTTFIKKGDPCTGMYLIIKGGVKLYQDEAKKKRIFLFKTVNDLIGLQSMMSGDNFTHSADALEDIVVGFIAKSQIEKLIVTYPQAFYSLLKKVNEKAEEMEQRSCMVMTGRAENIVLDAIEDLKKRFGVDKEGYVNVHISAQDLASYTCMSKTNLYRVLQTLKNKRALHHHLSRYRIEKLEV